MNKQLSVFNMIEQVNQEADEIVTLHATSFNKIMRPDLKKFANTLTESAMAAGTWEYSDEFLKGAREAMLGESIESFCKSNILQGDAEDLAIANESFVEHCATLVPIDPDLLDQHIDPDKFAYHLAYSNPELGAKLLAELQYYQSMGRF